MGNLLGPETENRHRDGAHEIEKLMQLTDLLPTYLDVCNPGGSPGTEKNHRDAIAAFGRTLGHDPTTADFTDENLGRHARLRLSAGIARDTVAGEQRKLFAEWRFAARRGMCPWPESRPIRVPRRVAIAWTRDEISAIWQACMLMPPVDDCPGFLWWRSLLSVLWDTGVRITEATRIQWEWIDFDRQQIHVPAEDRKGCFDDRLYDLTAESVVLLRLVPQTKAGPFAVNCHRSTLYNRYEKLLKLAGLPTDNKSKFHRIRRSAASHLAAAGGDSQKFLGHRDAATTELYLDPRILGKPSAVDLLFRPGA